MYTRVDHRQKLKRCLRVQEAFSATCSAVVAWHIHAVLRAFSFRVPEKILRASGM